MENATGKHEMLTEANRLIGLDYRVIILHGAPDGICTCGKSDCKSPGKHPRTSHGLRDATDDIAVVEQWFAKWPDSNLGMATDLLFVLDEDPGCEGWLPPERALDLAGCPKSRTPRGGYHTFMRAGDRTFRCSTSKIAAHVDVRAAGGYVVVHPSRIGNKTYEWIAPIDAPEELPGVPPWLVDLHDAKNEPPQKESATSNGKPSNGKSQKADKPAVKWNKGERNARLTSTAGKLRAAGLSADALRAALQQVNVDKCEPALTRAEVARIATSVSRYEPGKAKKKAKRSEKPLASEECDACLYGPLFAMYSKQDDVYRLRRWRGSWWWWANGAYRELPGEEVRSKVVAFLRERFDGLSRSHTSNVIDVLQSEVYLANRHEPPSWVYGDSLWDANDILATSTQLIHLPSLVAGEEQYAVPATPRFFTPAALGFPFAPDAPKPQLWLDTLREWCDGDEESIATVQEWTGLCLTADTSFQKILLVVGPKRSGKGTYARILRQLVGAANVVGPTLSSLGGPFGLWQLFGKSLAIVADARLGKRDSAITVERLLSVSGEDALTIDRKFQEPVTSKLPTRIMILTNELPKFADASGALASRMVAVPMPRSFYGREDHTLAERLAKELPGILLWAIAGWARLHQRGRLAQPPAGVALGTELADLASPIGKFVRECCVVGVGESVPKSDLYERYREWASESEGVRNPSDAPIFGRELRAVVTGIRDGRPRNSGSRVTTYEGIGLAQEY